MQEAYPQQLPPKGTAAYDARAAQDAQAFQTELAFQERVKQVEAAMSSMVDDAANIGTNTYGNFTLHDGSMVKLRLSRAFKYDPANPRWPGEDDVHVQLCEPANGHILNDVYLNRQPGGDFTVQVSDYGYTPTQDEPRYGLRKPQSGKTFFTPQEVAAEVPEFTHVAVVLHDISTQVTSERADAA